MRIIKLPQETPSEYHVRAAVKMAELKPQQLLEEYSRARFDCVRLGVHYASQRDKKPHAGAEYVNGWYSWLSDSGHKFPERRQDFVKRISDMWWMIEKAIEEKHAATREAREREYWECRGIETGMPVIQSCYY